jgi:putative ABC transport system permease protein
MLRTWFKTIIRNLWKNKTFSFLNIFGLAIGIACAGFIFLWVEDEKSYDDGYAKKDLIYTVVTHKNTDGNIYTFQQNNTPGLLAPAIKEEVPGVAATCRMDWGNDMLFTNNDKCTTLCSPNGWQRIFLVMIRIL